MFFTACSKEPAEVPHKPGGEGQRERPDRLESATPIDLNVAQSPEYFGTTTQEFATNQNVFTLVQIRVCQHLEIVLNHRFLCFFGLKICMYVYVYMLVYTLQFTV